MPEFFYNPLDMVELTASPASPPSGFRRVYTKSDGKIYQKTSAGVETALDNIVSSGTAYVVVNVTTATYTATATSGEVVILCNTTTAAGNITITIPTASANTCTYHIKKVDVSAFTVTIMPTTSTIEGATSAILKIGGASIDIVSDNTNWFII